jgi:lantibiotic modifying enzyme
MNGVSMDERFEHCVTEAVRRLRAGLDAVDPPGEWAKRDAICESFARTLRGLPPGRTRRFERTWERSALATVEAVDRFTGDRAEIIGALMGGKDPGPLIAVEPTTGDPHQGGRRVALLRFAERAAPLVYKPRSETSATFYSRVVDWLNGRMPHLGLASVRTLVRAGYGWADFVSRAPCRTPEDVERFYYRQGALLAILHATNGTDVHADNLIAQRDQPILVDTETLLHPVLRQPTLLAADPALVALAESVHQTILLPTLLHAASGTTDISGLGGHGERLPGAEPSANRPVLNGKLLEPADYVAQLLRGFADAYGVISQDPDSFVKVLEDAGGDIVVRVVARATRTYIDVLEGLQPFEALASMPTFDGSARLLPHERHDILNFDVPIFFTRPASRSIWTSRGTRLDDTLEVTGLDSARAKVRAMNDAERRRQEWIIDAAFATATGPITHRSEKLEGFPDLAAGHFSPLDPQWALDRAIEIAHRLDELAYRNGGRVNWLSLEPFEDGYWRVLPAGGGLPHGYPGVALFLAQLGAITGRAEFLERAAAAISSLPLLLGALADRPAHLAAIGPGFAGLGGIAYALTRLSILLDSAELASHATAAAALEAGMADEAGRVRATDRVSVIGDVDDGWCQGISGIAAAGRLEDTALGHWLDRLSRSAPLADLSLCHGELGVLDALAFLARRQARAGEVLERRGSALLWAFEHGACLVGTPRGVPAPGVMHGLAGSGYGLLRTAFARTVPSVLMMEATGDDEFG